MGFTRDLIRELLDKAYKKRVKSIPDKKPGENKSSRVISKPKKTIKR